MKYPTWVVLLALLVEVVLSGNVRAQPEEMTFLTQPPIPPAEIFGNAWTIFAEGPIDPGASARFRASPAAFSVVRFMHSSLGTARLDDDAHGQLLG
jgi:hypothetical protein